MKRKQSEQPERRVEYFVPGQVVLVVEPANPIEQDQAEKLIEEVTGRAFVGDRVGGAVADPARVVLFDHGVSDDYVAGRRTAQEASRKRFLPNNRAGQAFDVRDLRSAARRQFALIPYTFETTNQQPRELAALIDGLNRDIRIDLGRRIKARGALAQDELLVRAASPNWLAAPQAFVATTSPGARPRPAKPDEWRIEFPKIRALGETSQGKGVDVAILDSAPGVRQLVHAYDQWVVGHTDPHPLLKRLLDNNGQFAVGAGSRLELVTAADLGVALPDPEAYRVREHDYPMSDHGLFIAGIINSIAPEAHLQLIEVLNQYGVGTLESISRGLEWVAADRRCKAKTNPLVVNMSLGLGIPPREQLKRDLGWDVSPEDYPLLALSLEWICAALRNANNILVAAAGNNADDPGVPTRPEANFPAAFQTVLGVGALLEDSDQPADYSNLADRPDGIGVWTFGGKAVNDEAVPEAGMLGVYIGGFPTMLVPGSHGFLQYQTVPSDNGWGWWAGTSFAAPIVSGTLAALAEQSGALNLQTAEDAFDSMLVDNPLGGILRAKQG